METKANDNEPRAARRSAPSLIGATAPAVGLALALGAAAAHAGGISLTAVGTYETGAFDEAAQEIGAYDADSRRLFVTNAEDGSIDILDVSDPSVPALVRQVDLQSLLGSAGVEVGPNSVAVDDGLVAVAVGREDTNGAPLPGAVAFLDTEGNLIAQVTVGFLPDMLTFTPDGKRVVVANEGEPNSYLQPDSVDPEGSVSVIRIRT